MNMMPNYIIALLSVLFLIRSFVVLHIRKSTVNNRLTYGMAIVLAVLLLGMSVYGIVFKIPLGQVQTLIESYFKSI